MCESTFCSCNKIPETKAEEETFTWLTVSEVLVHGGLTLLLWVCGKAEQGRTKFIAVEKQRGGPQGFNIYFKGIPPMT